MKCRTCKTKLTNESKVKLGYCSQECKGKKTRVFWTGITDVFYFVIEILSIF